MSRFIILSTKHSFYQTNYYKNRLDSELKSAKTKTIYSTTIAYLKSQI